MVHLYNISAIFACEIMFVNLVSKTIRNCVPLRLKYVQLNMNFKKKQ